MKNMINKAYEHGYGIEWQDFCVRYREAYHTSVTDFHVHDFFEVNLILSGNVNILMKDQVEEGKGNYIVLTSPGTPHYIRCASDTLYKRLYLMVSSQFIVNYMPEWEEIISLFRKRGRIIHITGQEAETYENIIKQIEGEKNRFRQRLLILYLFSYLSEKIEDRELDSQKIPQYIMDALNYVNEHLGEKIVARQLAEKLYISRTTLLTTFKQYTGVTLNNYILNCRIKKAISLLKEGKAEYEIAEICGFSDSAAFIKSFKKVYHITPMQYLKER